MSSSETPLLHRRRLLVLLGAVPLSACGFTPVYGPGGAGRVLQDRLAFAEPGDVLSFNLVARLEDRLGRAAAPDYTLGYAIATAESELAVTGTDDVNRVNISGTVDFSVTEIASGATVQSGEVATFTAFATTGSPVATLSARRDAQQRLMTALADQIVTRLMAGAATWP
jgi:LPS-assembly lipoprotein